MAILSAFYRNRDVEQEIVPNQINIESYETRYKGNLYCPMPACEAKIEYVHRAATVGYFRTWKHEDHIDTCIHKFDRVANREGRNIESVLNVEISAERKKKSLKDAFARAVLTEEERAARIAKRKKRNANPKAVGKANRPNVNLVLRGGVDEGEARQQGIRSPNLLKKDTDSLKDSDVGKPRLIIGMIQGVEYEESRAIITIAGQKRVVDVMFEEAFFANSPSYQNLFHYVERFIYENNRVIFTAVGEVRAGKTEDSYEFVVFHGDEFAIHGHNLMTIAVHFTQGLFE